MWRRTGKGVLLRIDSSKVGMESERTYESTKTSSKRFLLSDYAGGNASKDGLNAFVSYGNGENAGKQTEYESDSIIAVSSDWQERFEGRYNASFLKISVTSNESLSATRNVGVTQTGESGNGENSIQAVKRQALLYIFEILFGKKRDKLKDLLDRYGFETAQAGTGMTAQGPVTLTYENEQYFNEKENTSFSSKGTVKTADGRTIDFDINVGMSREFEEYFKENMQIQKLNLCDPLVIHLNDNVAGLSDQTFFFDIDADGVKDEISELSKGSGYLALDKNGDGIINDGSELFGTKSGNGFKELSAYDDDGDGWIDEDDEVWSKLKIWTKDEAGKDILLTLKEAGVGAINLQSAKTNFSLNDDKNNTRGVIRNTGIFLYENGNVGTVQHLDVNRYSKLA